MLRTGTCLLLLTLYIFASHGCRGYEDGPIASMRTVKKRLCEGWWELESFTKNGTENAGYADTVLIGHGEEFHQLAFSYEADENDINATIKAVSGRSYPGYYDLNVDKSVLGLRLGIAVKDFYILRLTNRELHILSKDDHWPSVFVAFKKIQ